MTVSSVIDRILINKQSSDAKVYYKSEPKKTAHKWLTLFSIRRNWFTLVAPSNPDHRDLRFIQAMRARFMWLFVFGHVCYFSEFLPAINPEIIESVSNRQLQLSFTIKFMIHLTVLLQPFRYFDFQRVQLGSMVLGHQWISSDLRFPKPQRIQIIKCRTFYQIFCSKIHQVCASPSHRNSSTRNVVAPFKWRTNFHQTELR